MFIAILPCYIKRNYIIRKRMKRSWHYIGGRLQTLSNLLSARRTADLCHVIPNPYHPQKDCNFLFCTFQQFFSGIRYQQPCTAAYFNKHTNRQIWNDSTGTFQRAFSTKSTLDPESKIVNENSATDNNEPLPALLQYQEDHYHENTENCKSAGPVASTTSGDWLNQVNAKLKESSMENVVDVFLDHWKNDAYNNQETFNFRIIALLHNLRNAPQQAEDFIKTLHQKGTSNNAFVDSMENDGNNNNNNVSIEQQNYLSLPQREHYHMVMHSWMNYDPPSAKRVQSLLEYMAEYAGIQYETDSCNLVLQAWASKGNAERTQKNFNTMIKEKNVQPNLESFYYVLDAWSKSKSSIASKYADTLLSLMKTKYNIEPTPTCLLRVIECWVKTKRKGITETRIESLFAWMIRRIRREGKDLQEVDIKAVQSGMWNVLQAYQSVRNAHRAEELLLDFVEEYRRNRIIVPTVDMFVSVLNTWSTSKSSHRAYRAEKILLKMKSDAAIYPRPTLECYTSVLHCYSGSLKSNSAHRAESILRSMEEEDGLSPTLASFTHVLIAWARTNDVNIASIGAERIYQEIIDRGMAPDRFVFCGLINAWGRNKSEDAILKVEEYFQRIKDMSHDQGLHDQENSNSTNYKPTVVEYTAIIQAYANYVSTNVNKSRMAVARVETLLDEMLDSEDPSVRPNVLTYAAALKTIAGARRIPDRRDRADAILQRMYSENVEISSYISRLVKKCNVRESKSKSKLSSIE